VDSVWKVGGVGLVSLLLMYVAVGVAKHAPVAVVVVLPALLVVAASFIYVVVVGTWFALRRSLGLDPRSGPSSMDGLADRFASLSIERRVLLALAVSLVLAAVALLYRT
jgi:ABC-type sugar transport system permease subunit